MLIRLTRKLAECIDGVDLSAHRVGQIIDLPERDAALLIAERWAKPTTAEFAQEGTEVTEETGSHRETEKQRRSEISKTSTL